MRVTVLYIREYPTEIGETIARILKDVHYTLTGSMQPELTWELAISNASEYTITLLECAVSEYVVQGSYTIEVDSNTHNDYYITRLLATSRGIDVAVGVKK